MLGAFSLVLGPLLVVNAPYTLACQVALGLWVLTCIMVLLVRRRRSHARIEPADTVASPRPLLAIARADWGRILLLVFFSALASFSFSRFDDYRRVTALLCLLALLANLYAIWRSGGLRAPRIASAGLEGGRLERAVSVGMFLLAIVGATFWVREDADDVLYMGAALMLQDAQSMGIETPAHRGEGLPSTAAYAWQSFELWGSILADHADLHVLPAFRTALAPVLVCVSLLLYRVLLGSLLPRALLPIAMTALIAYFAFGLSSPFASNVYLLSRSAQGKSWLIHVGLPAMVILVRIFLRHPRPGLFAALMLVSFACLGFAPSAVFVAPVVLSVCAIAVLATSAELWSGGSVLAGVPKLGRLLCLGLAVVPFLAFGLYVIANQSAAVETLGYGRTYSTTWIWTILFHHLDFDSGGGAIEIFLLLTAPMAVALLPRGAAWAFPLAFTAILFLTILNPLAFPLVASVVGATAYQRFMWAVPFPIFVGLLAALVGVRLPAPARRCGCPGDSTCDALIGRPSAVELCFGRRNSRASVLSIDECVQDARRGVGSGAGIGGQRSRPRPSDPLCGAGSDSPRALRPALQFRLYTFVSDGGRSIEGRASRGVATTKPARQRIPCRRAHA